VQAREVEHRGGLAVEYNAETVDELAANLPQMIETTQRCPVFMTIGEQRVAMLDADKYEAFMQHHDDVLDQRDLLEVQLDPDAGTIPLEQVHADFDLD
jgi:hypothetical protein